MPTIGGSGGDSGDGGMSPLPVEGGFSFAMLCYTPSVAECWWGERLLLFNKEDITEEVDGSDLVQQHLCWSVQLPP